jgi:V/A-type H+-transporting ATPase subunit I
LNPPLYGTVDPTPFIAFFFPLYFGFIIGDIGYGAVLGTVSIWLLFKFRKNEIVKSIGKILLICSLWTIFFGFIFGELFGDFGEHMHIVKPLSDSLNRMKENSIYTLLGMALVFGIVQIFVGYVIGIVNGIRHRSVHHVVEPIAFMLGLSGIFIAILGITGVIGKSAIWLGCSFSVISMGMLAWFVGIAGPIELFSALGNVLSFARLFAIGLSAVYLAYAANVIAKVIGMSGNVIAIILGIIVAIVLIHPLFLIVGLISPIAQPARLQLVEFFTKFKFYDSIGKSYKPFQSTIK